MPEPRGYGAVKPLGRQMPRGCILLRMPPDQCRDDPERRGGVDPEGRSQAPNRDHQTREGWADRAADIHPDAVERDGRLKMRARHELRHDRLPGGHDQRRRCSGQNDKREQNAGSDPACVNQKSECGDENGGRNLHGNEKTPPVDDISERPRRQGEKEHRHRCRDLNERNQEWIGRQSGHEPAGRGVLHPHADVGDDGCEPQHGESRVAEGRQRRTVGRRLCLVAARKSQGSGHRSPHWPGLSRFA
jgi:hypothetical protein